jgi:hypothetical protein
VGFVSTDRHFSGGLSGGRRTEEEGRGPALRMPSAN